MSETTHRDQILDQFTRQATPFATAPGIKDEAALTLVLEFSGVGPNDTVLDVACGPGILACAFAHVAKHVTGIDITPAMLDRARALQKEKNLTNITWQQGDVLPLPYPDASFSIVSARFAFHHFLEPRKVLAEMKRACKPGGTVLVIDSTPAPDKADAFNRMEVVRDPSHVRAMPVAEHLSHFAAVGLPEPRQTAYRLEGELEALIGRSFPKPGDDETLRRLFRASIANDELGVGAKWVGEQIHYHFPVAVLAATRA